MERVFDAQPAFDPASSSREFTLLVSDYIVAVLGDTIAALLADEAPNARLRLTANTPAAVDRAEQLLLSTDLLVLPHGFVSDLSHCDLYRDEWVCIVAADHPAVQDGLTVEDLETLPGVVTFHGPTAATPASRQMPHARHRAERPGDHRELPDRPRTGGGQPTCRTPAEEAGRPAAAECRRPGAALPRRGGAAGRGDAWRHPVYDDDPEHAYLRYFVQRAAEIAVGQGSGLAIDVMDTRWS